MPEDTWHIATERVKWSVKYQKKHGIDTGEAELTYGMATRVQHLAKRVYRGLELTGYARVDMRLAADGRIFVIEANPNPQLAQGEDFAESAKRAKVSYAELLERIMALGLQWQPERTASNEPPSRVAAQPLALATQLKDTTADGRAPEADPRRSPGSCPRCRPRTRSSGSGCRSAGRWCR